MREKLEKKITKSKTEKTELKKRIRELKAERNQAITNKDKKSLELIRNKIKRLNRQVKKTQWL